MTTEQLYKRDVELSKKFRSKDNETRVGNIVEYAYKTATNDVEYNAIVRKELTNYKNLYANSILITDIRNIYSVAPNIKTVEGFLKYEETFNVFREYSGSQRNQGISIIIAAIIIIILLYVSIFIIFAGWAFIIANIILYIYLRSYTIPSWISLLIIITGLPGTAYLVFLISLMTQLNGSFSEY